MDFAARREGRMVLLGHKIPLGVGMVRGLPLLVRILMAPLTRCRAPPGCGRCRLGRRLAGRGGRVGRGRCRRLRARIAARKDGRQQQRYARNPLQSRQARLNSLNGLPDAPTRPNASGLLALRGRIIPAGFPAASIGRARRRRTVRDSLGGAAARLIQNPERKRRARPRSGRTIRSPLARGRHVDQARGSERAA